MSNRQLDNLVRIGQLKSEPPADAEIQGLVRSGLRRLDDAERQDLNLESRFDLAYNAAHALALAALRLRGYRSESRYLVFQCLQHTVDLPVEQRRVPDRPTAGATWPNTRGTWMWTNNLLPPRFVSRVRLQAGSRNWWVDCKT